MPADTWDSARSWKKLNPHIDIGRGAVDQVERGFTCGFIVAALVLRFLSQKLV